LPEVALLDELAHTNVPGFGRHDKTPARQNHAGDAGESRASCSALVAASLAAADRANRKLRR
jgi:hypothetical protein